MEFEERLKKWIYDNKIKQVDIANRAGVNKSYVSAIVNGKCVPSNNFIEALSEMSGKSAHWWLFGKDKNDSLDALNALVNLFISTGEIKTDGTYDEKIKTILVTMLDKEIKDKLDQQKK
ncbi:MAG: helix-turn-helix transcriptional regulator [Clostridium butyricum]|nr:helix-turn-helix transcriptional regulator [Clostridium butyricum]